MNPQNEAAQGIKPCPFFNFAAAGPLMTSAMDKIIGAVYADREGKYLLALKLYDRAIEQFIQAVNSAEVETEKDEEIAGKQFTEYEDRAAELRRYLTMEMRIKNIKVENMVIATTCRIQPCPFFNICPRTPLLQKSKDILVDAVVKDRKEKLSMALKLYEQGIQLFKQGINTEVELARDKEILRKQLVAYVDRATEIRNYQPCLSCAAF